MEAYHIKRIIHYLEMAKEYLQESNFLGALGNTWAEKMARGVDEIDNLIEVLQNQINKQ